MAASLKFLDQRDFAALENAKLSKRELLSGFLHQKLPINVTLTEQGEKKLKEYLSLEDKDVNKFVALFKDVFPSDLHTVPDAAVEQQQRQVLGPLFKTLLPTNRFNPSEGFAPLWMPHMFNDDPVYLQLLNDLPSTNHQFYLLQSVSGSGKTGKCSSNQDNLLIINRCIIKACTTLHPVLRTMSGDCKLLFYQITLLMDYFSQM